MRALRRVTAVVRPLAQVRFMYGPGMVPGKPTAPDARRVGPTASANAKKKGVGEKTVSTSDGGEKTLGAFASIASKAREQGLVSTVQSMTGLNPAQREARMMEEMYEKSLRLIIDPKDFTYGAYGNFLRGIYDAVGGNKLRAKIGAKNPALEQIEQQISIIESMNAVELASNHERVFSLLSKQLIAEKAGISVKAFDNFLVEHTGFLAQRNWLHTRQLLKQPMPTTFEDAEYLAEMDRPFSDAERKLYKEFNEQNKTKQIRLVGKGRNGPTGKHVRARHYRYPSKDLSRWSTQGPKWFPRFHQRKARHQNRVRRLS
mmetsp:Transcript_13864/g.31211  ORF Transcript_13864/g.31211 Transcript_13864/m.31211 type:complete len:316 (+) Transcript_13864:39-986(+)